MRKNLFLHEFTNTLMIISIKKLLISQLNNNYKTFKLYLSNF